MLHSECEAVEHVTLEPAGVLEGRGREGVEEAWIVLGGKATFRNLRGGAERSASPGRLVLCRDGGHVTVRNDGDQPAELLVVSVLPAATTLCLPPRSPVMKEVDR